MSPVSAPRPRVVILLSTYNGAAFLEAQLESLRQQKGVSIQLHVRDDGSTDGTRDVLLRHAAIWPELAAFAGRGNGGENMGPCASFLYLLRTAPDADYYAFCDQDDIWLPHKLAGAVAKLADEDGPALFCSNVALVDAQLAPIGTPPPHTDLSFGHLLFENYATGCTMVLNAKAGALINDHPPLIDSTIMHDWWCALVLSALGQVHYDDEPQLLYRQHGRNAVGMKGSKLMQVLVDLARLVRAHRGFYPIHAQARELLRLYGDRLPARERVLVEQLVSSKSSLSGRVRYAFSGTVVRQHIMDALMVRGLILAGWY